MSDPPTPPADEKGFMISSTHSSDDEQSHVHRKYEVYEIAAIDPVLAKKMAAVNNAIDEIGLTGYHWKLFCLNGFGYAVDSVSHHRRLKSQTI